MKVSIGPYRVEREIARGANGVVLRALGPQGTVAIKVLLPERLRDPDDIERFHREGEVAARLRHRAIVPLLDRGMSPHGPYHVYAFVPGQTLRARIRAEGRLDPKEAARLALELGEALEHAHALGVLHRDLKPANVLLTPSGEPRLTDFGLAQDQHSGSRLTLSGEIMGSPVFMPPEQALGRRRQIGPPSDVYGLGAMLYAMLTGHPPVTGSGVEEVLHKVRHGSIASPVTLAPAVPPRLAAICMRCLEKHPDDRYPTMAELTHDLRQALAPEEVEAQPSPRRGLAPLWIGLGLGALAVALAVGARGYAAVTAPAPEPAPAVPPSPPLPAEPAPQVSAEDLVAEAEASWERRDTNAARREAQRALELDPECGEAHLLLGRLLEDEGERVRALEAWGRAAARGVNVEAVLAPLYPDPVERRLVWLTFVPEAGELAEAAALCTKLIEGDETLDAAAVLRTLDACAEDMRDALAGLEGEARLEALVREAGARFKGASFDYYQPRKSQLPHVLESGTGTHVACTVILIALGERLGVELRGVCHPAWLLVRAAGEPLRVINPCAAAFMDREQLARLVEEDQDDPRPFDPAVLREATRQEVLFRYVWWQRHNLGNRGEEELAQRARDVGLLIAVDDADALFKRAFGRE